jgi:4-hydroxybenzoate polyprenyltransferase
LLALGILFALGTDIALRNNSNSQTLTFGSVATAIVLSGFILLYDVVAKKTWAGPWLMGCCRTCSLLLGAAAGGLFVSGDDTSVPRAAIAIAVIGHGVYVAGFTLAGRKEAATSTQSDLLTGWIICISGVFILACVDYAATYFGIDNTQRRFASPYVYPALIGILALPLLRHILRTLQTKAGREIQGAIKQAIITIIFFDAAIAAQFGSGTQAVVICALIVPMLLLGKWLYST